MRRSTLILRLILGAAPALADPAHVGCWSMLPNYQCPVTITVKSVQGYGLPFTALVTYSRGEPSGEAVAGIQGPRSGMRQ